MSMPLFCAGKPEESALYATVEAHLTGCFPDVTIRHSRTQTAFVRQVQFAWVSLPRRRADAGAVMLSIGMTGPVESPRILYRAEVAPGRWMHHMLLRRPEELDDEVCAWLEAAWALVGCGRRTNNP